MTNTFFTSDQHFYHKKILEYCPDRKGSTVAEMNELLLQAWNDKVGQDDTVYHLGDVSFGGHDETLDILNRLHGKIHLVLGNHDKLMKTEKIRQRFESIQEYKTIKLDGVHIVLFHFPIESWDRMGYGAYHLFGHVHGNTSHGGVPAVPNRMDVGVDTRSDMAPWSWEAVKAYLSWEREFIVGNTIEEIREAKLEVEYTITGLLRDFESTYDLSIRDVRVEVLHPIGSKPSVGFVMLDVEI